MKKGRWIAVEIVVLALACIGLSALLWGEMVYWRGGGERGCSLGPALYRLFGWGGAEEYRADFGRPEKGEAPEETLPPRFERHRAFGPWRRIPFGPAFRPMFRPFRLLGGLFCLGFLVTVIVAAGVLYHRRRSGQLTPQNEWSIHCTARAMAYQTILVVEDEPHIVEVVQDYLRLISALR